jgi:hypothetical protein
MFGRFWEQCGGSTTSLVRGGAARLSRLPDMAREAVRRRAEVCARGADESVSLASVEAAIAESRSVMDAVMQAGGHKLRPRQGE